MKIRYEMDTPWPADVKNPEGFEVVGWYKYGEMPILPVAGMLIDNGDGDFHRVVEVYWQVDAPDIVTVFFDESDDKLPINRKQEYWTRGGWQSDDLPKRKSKRGAQ